MAENNLKNNKKNMSKTDDINKQEEKSHVIRKNELQTLNIRRVPSNVQEKRPLPNQSQVKQQADSVKINQTGHSGDQKSDLSANNKLEHTIQVPFEKINSQLEKTNSDDRQILHRSNRNLENDQTIVRKNSMAYDTETLKQYLNKSNAKKKKDIKEQSLQQMHEDIEHGSKLYELIGYTTVGKVNYSFEKENRQKFMRNTLITILLVIIIVLAILIMNPVKDGIDFNKILGIDSKYRYDEPEQTDSVNYSEIPSTDKFNENGD